MFTETPGAGPPRAKTPPLETPPQQPRPLQSNPQQPRLWQPYLWQQWLSLSALLALLFAVLQPPPSAHLPFYAALLYWGLHVGVGMLCALAAAAALLRCGRWMPRHPWPTLLLAGLAGALLFAPLALGLESLFPRAPDAPADDWLDHWEAAGGLRAVTAEFLSLLPSYLPAWLLINAAPMLQARQPVLQPDVAAEHAMLPAAEHDTAALEQAQQPLALVALPAPAAALPAHTTSARRNDAEPKADDGLLDRLPLAVGRQLISISADLHYLQVSTRRGRATLLGSLGEAEAELGTLGVRIHRSHWVATAAVTSLRRTARGWRCELCDGRTLPVSRRRAASIKQLLGTDFVVDAMQGKG